MIKLKENQKSNVLKTGNKWYICVSDEKGLISYSENPYLEDDKINVKKLQESYNKIKDFDLAKEILNSFNTGWYLSLSPTCLTKTFVLVISVSLNTNKVSKFEFSMFLKIMEFGWIVPVSPNEVLL